VLGDSGYYGCFGFQPAIRRSFSYAAAPFEAAFQVIELRPDAAQGVSGEMCYGPEFDAL